MPILPYTPNYEIRNAPLQPEVQDIYHELMADAHLFQPMDMRTDTVNTEVVQPLGIDANAAQMQHIRQNRGQEMPQDRQLNNWQMTMPPITDARHSGNTLNKQYGGPRTSNDNTGHATSANISAAGGTVKSPTSFGAMFSSLPFARWAQRGIASSQSSKTGSSSAKNSLVSASATLNTDAASMRSSDSRNSRQYNPYQHFTTTMPTFMDRNGTQSSSYMANLAVGSQLNQNRDKIREWVKDQAQELRTKYFTNTDDSSSSDQHHVTSLSVLSKLTKTTELLKNKENFDPMPLHQLKTIIVDSDVSSFEIMHSGLVNALLHYLTDGSDSLTPRESTGDGSSYSMSKSNARKSTAVAQKSPVEVRLKHFCAIFLNLTESTENDVIRLDVDNAPALSLLVSKLNSCLTLIEQFPVKVHDLPGGPQGCLRGVSALKFFHTHQIKCNLKRHPDCHSLKQWKKGAVKIDPLALVSAVERYMLQKGYGRLREDDDDDMTDDDASDEDLEDALNTLASHSSGQHKLQFLVNDHPLPYNVTIYQAIRQYGMGLLSGGGGENSHGASSPSETDNEGEMGVVSYASIWVNTHTLTYRPIPENQSKNETGCGPGSTAHSNKKQQPHQDAAASTTKNGGPKSPKHLKSESLAWTEGHIPGLRNPLVPFLTTQLSAGLNSNDASVECLALLRVLHALNRFWWTLFMKTHTVPSFSPVVPGVEFVNTKLAAKANRQLQDPLVIMTGNLPSWLRQIAYACPFVFPFETRQLLFYVVAFDRDRALQRLLDTCPDLLGPQEGSERITPRLERKKTTIQRDDLLKQAEQVMNDASNSLAVLEVQYKDEVGTGLGPTLEFFALVSQEFQKVDLELWRSEKLLNVTDAESLSEYVFAGQGLYPSALGHQPKPSLLGKVRGKFKFFGKFMARALMDSRMIDVPLSSVFYKWLLREESFLSRADLVHLDSTLGSSISQLNEFVIRKQKLSLPGDEMTLVALSQEIVDLDLDFTLPGYASLELLKGGKHKPVTIENLEHYLALISHNLLVIGVQRQMEAFREGFESVFPLTNLKMFYSDELDQVFCGSASGSGTSGWDSQVILQYIKPDHGYNHNSPQIKWLAQMLQQFDAEQQRGFLQFLTGCPKLPVGGFKNLSPTLTVVRKGVDAGEDPDHYLPSVMTCVNYLKLPEYGSLETMTDRMLIAIREGQRSFHLS